MGPERTARGHGGFTAPAEPAELCANDADYGLRGSHRPAGDAEGTAVWGCTAEGATGRQYLTRGP